MTRARVLVTVGTDHHPFERLVLWSDVWAARHPDVDVFVQHGTASAPKVADGASLIDPADLATRMASATAVVTHGGLSSIMEARAAGFLPIVVARDPAAGEHVDGHQQAFTTHQERLGRLVRARTEQQLFDLLDAALADPASIRLDRASTSVAGAVDEVAGLVQDLVTRRPSRRRAKARR